MMKKMRRKLVGMMSALNKKDNALTFTAVVANSSVQLAVIGTPAPVTLEYNLNNGGWLPYTVGDTISMPNVGDKVKMRGNNERISLDSSNYYNFVMQGVINATGHITSLLDGIGGNINVPDYSFLRLFSTCTALNRVEIINYSNYSGYCFVNAFYGCTNVLSHHVETIDNSTYMYHNNLSCQEFIIDDKTPPSINSTTIIGLKADCAIYVPAASVDAYKAAQYWSARSAYIQAIP